MRLSVLDLPKHSPQPDQKLVIAGGIKGYKKRMELAMLVSEQRLSLNNRVPAVDEYRPRLGMNML